MEKNGNLVPIESDRDIPFRIERIFYVYGIEDKETRGKHAHYDTKQLLICINGSIDVICHDGINQKKWTLNKRNQALYIPELIWDEQIYEKDSMLLVLSDTLYDKEDYIEDFDEFLKIKKINQCTY